MDAERSILVEKFPKTSGTKTSFRTTVVQTIPERRVTITDEADDYQRLPAQLPDNIPAPDYPVGNESKKQASRKVLLCYSLF